MASGCVRCVGIAAKLQHDDVLFVNGAEVEDNVCEEDVRKEGPVADTS